jgi:hypothetical protein
MEWKDRKKNLWVLIGLVMLAMWLLGRVFFYGFLPHFLGFLIPREDAFARDYVLLLQKGDLEQAKAYMAPDLTEKDRQSLPQLRGYFDHLGEMGSVHLLNFSYFKTGGGKPVESLLTYYADFQRGSTILQFILLPNGGQFWVKMFKYQQLSQSFQTATHFSLSGKPPFHYLFLSLTLLMPFFTFFALVRCLKSRVGRKWLWIPFIVAGLGKATLLWDGPGPLGDVFRWKWLALQAFSGSVSKNSFVQPWTVVVSIPLGALFFILWEYISKRLEAKDGTRAKKKVH